MNELEIHWKMKSLKSIHFISLLKHFEMQKKFKKLNKAFSMHLWLILYNLFQYSWPKNKLFPIFTWIWANKKEKKVGVMALWRLFNRLQFWRPEINHFRDTCSWNGQLEKTRSWKVFSWKVSVQVGKNWGDTSSKKTHHHLSILLSNFYWSFQLH